MPSYTNFVFTKLAVHDLEAMAKFYRTVYGLHVVEHIYGEHIGDEAIDEIVMSADPTAAWGSLVLLKYLNRAPPSNGEVILGFITDDLSALLGRARAAGGNIHSPIVEMPAHSLSVAFATDPEGHLAEVIQLL